MDVAINPRQVIAEELVRFGHDPRIRQIAMLDDDRFEILDLTVRAESELADTRFDDLPKTGSVIGAIIRDGTPIFPHGDDILKAGRPRDRVRGVARAPRSSNASCEATQTGIDIGSALDLVGGVLKWLAPAFLRARRGRDRLRRAVLGVPRRGRDHRPAPGSRSTRSPARSRAPRSRRARASWSSP